VSCCTHLAAPLTFTAQWYFWADGITVGAGDYTNGWVATKPYERYQVGGGCSSCLPLQFTQWGCVVVAALGCCSPAARLLHRHMVHRDVTAMKCRCWPWQLTEAAHMAARHHLAYSLSAPAPPPSGSAQHLLPADAPCD
jgi:hypothetical protein